jgi:hypothetical protein
LQTLVDTVLFHFDALTGEPVDQTLKQQDKLIHGVDIIQGPAADVVLLDGEDGKVVVMVDDFGKVRFFLLFISHQSITLTFNL